MVREKKQIKSRMGKRKSALGPAPNTNKAAEDQEEKWGTKKLLAWPRSSSEDSTSTPLRLILSCSSLPPLSLSHDCIHCCPRGVGSSVRTAKEEKETETSLYVFQTLATMAATTDWICESPAKLKTAPSVCSNLNANPGEQTIEQQNRRKKQHRSVIETEEDSHFLLFFFQNSLKKSETPLCSFIQLPHLV